MKEAWDIDFLSENTSPSECARFALADSMAQRWVAKLRSLTENETNSGEDTGPAIGDWAPQLIAIQHPFVVEVDPTALVSQLKFCSRRDVKEYGAIGFCLAAAILQQGLSAIGHEDTEALHPICEKIRQTQVALLSTFDPVPIVIACILACTLVSSDKSSAGQIKLPSPRKIPFRSFLDFLLPFFGTNKFHQDTDMYSLPHLRESTTRSFLEAGEWVGYYSYGEGSLRGRLDPPMHRIHFSATPDSSPGRYGFALAATGTNGVDRFSLTYGFYSVAMQLVPRNFAGTVTAFFLSSGGNYHDEIDFEFLGNVSGQPYILQTNLFASGVGGREQRIFLWFDPTADFHTYGIIWNHAQIIFQVDDTPIRIFKNLQNLGLAYPTSQPTQSFATIFEANRWATRGDSPTSYGWFSAIAYVYSKHSLKKSNS